MSKLLLAIPTHDARAHTHTMLAAYQSPPAGVKVDRIAVAGALLAYNFNQALCVALNRGYEYLAMLHADIDPGPQWLPRLYSVLTDTAADLVAAVVPLKSGDGMTSTAIGHPDPWQTQVHLDAAALDCLPPFFASSDLGGKPLLVNSGCWLADLRRPVFRQENEAGELRAYFTINDRIRRNSAGQWVADVEPEDWFFSRRLHELGATVVAVQTLELTHYGQAGFQLRPKAGR